MYIIFQGIQTDPKHDPLSLWSKVVDKDSSWRPPMPPQGWVDYDPVATHPNEEGKLQPDLGKAMMKGIEPNAVEEETSHALEFIEKEVTQLISG